MTEMLNPIDVYRFAQQGYEQGAAKGKNERLNKLTALASQAGYGAADPYINEAMTVDAGTGRQLQQNIEADHEATIKKAAGAAQYVLNATKSGNPQAVQGAYQAVRPYLAKLGEQSGRTPPEQWSDDMLPMVHQVIAEAGGVNSQGDSVQSTYINQAGERVAIMRDGSQKVLGAAENRLQALDYGDRSVAFDPRTATVRELGVGGQPQAAPQISSENAPMQATAANGTPIVVDPNVDPKLRAQIMANPTQFDAAASGEGSFTPQTVVNATPAAPRKGVSPQAAQSQSNDDRRFNFDQYKFAEEQRQKEEAARAAAVQRAKAAEDKAKAASEKTRNAATLRNAQISNVDRGIARVEAALRNLEKGRVADTGTLDQFVNRFTPEGKELEAAVGAMQNSFLGLTRVPGMGSQSDMEAKIANLQYPSLGMPMQSNKKTIANLRAFLNDLKGQSSAAPAPAPASGGWSISEVK